MEYFLSNHLIIREWLNGATYPLAILLTLVIVRHLYLTWWRLGRGWASAPGIATACVLAWLFFAESLRAGVVWFILRSQNLSDPVEKYSIITNSALIVTGLILVATMLRCMYLFTPPNWGHKPWIAAIIITTLFLLTSQTLATFGI